MAPPEEIRQLTALGYELLPAWWVKTAQFNWTTSSTYHNIHHQKSQGNHALFFRFWDRLLGTELPGYDAAYVDRREPHASPVSQAGTP